MTLFAAKTKRQAEPAEPQTKPRRKLTRAERKQIEAAIARANRTGKKEQSAQDSIPYERMWPDGICKVADGRYTKTIQFQDINYQLSQNEDKTAIFEGWCDFLNYFDSSIRFQLSFLNLAASQETFANSITIPAQGDDFDPIRVEYTQMLQNQLARGNNGLIKTKYLTFSIEADSIRSAKPRLERIETDVLNNFKRLGVAAEVLDGKARLAQLHAIFHMDEQAPFQFEWDWLAPSGLSTKDFIAPSGFEFRTGKQFRMGKIRGGQLRADSGPGAERPDAGRFSRYGEFSHREPAHPVGGPGESHQDSETEDHRPGPFQNRGTEEGRPRRV